MKDTQWEPEGFEDDFSDLDDDSLSMDSDDSFDMDDDYDFPPIDEDDDYDFPPIDEEDDDFDDEDLEDLEAFEKAAESRPQRIQRETRPSRIEEEYNRLEEFEDENPAEIENFISSADYEDNEDDLDVIREQVLGNVRGASVDDSLPDDISLINEPQDFREEPRTSAGDSSIVSKSFLVSLAVVVLVAAAGILTSLVLSSDVEEVSARHGNNRPGVGTPLESAQAESPELGNESPTPSPTQQEDNSGDAGGDVPEGGSLVSYDISTEGDIAEVSLSYIGKNGEAQSLSGVDLPWSTDVGLEEGIKPIIKANSRGHGTVTCSILVDGKQVKTNSQAGDSPSVSCE